MTKKNQFLLWALCFLFLPDLVSKDSSNFRNISILADQVTLIEEANEIIFINSINCLLYTSPSPRDRTRSRMPSSA